MELQLAGAELYFCSYLQSDTAAAVCEAAEELRNAMHDGPPLA